MPLVSERVEGITDFSTDAPTNALVVGVRETVLLVAGAGGWWMGELTFDGEDAWMRFWNR